MDLEEKIKNCEINIKKLNEIQNDYNLIMHNRLIDIKINNKKKEKNEILKEMECPIKTNNEYILLLKDKEKLDNTEKQQLIFNEMEYKLNILMKNSNLTKEELKKLSVIKDDLNRSIGEITMTHKIYAEKNEIITNIKNEYGTMIKIIDLYNKYEMMNYLLNKYITQLEQIINNILMSIVFYKIKIIQENSELRIYKLENNIIINTRQLSGNEKFVINIAFKCGLNKMAISYKSDFIIIDEGFGSFDSDKLNKIGELFDVMKREFDKCIIISHLDKIKNMNKTVLMVERGTDGYSKII
jgi:DNA repair exonuclease SbcCD ATPase subunit